MAAVNTWSTLTRALESQFGPSPFDCPMAELFKLQQDGSMSDFYMKFMSLANRSVGLIDEALLNCFLSGLHVEIKRDVLSLSPPTLLRVVALAKLFKERYIPVPKTSNTTYTTRYSRISTVGPNSTGQTKSLSQASLPPLLPTPTGPPLRQSGVKKISPAEMQLRRDKGLCYFCDDKFTFNHKCLNRQFLLLQLDVDEGEEFVSCESQPVIKIEGVEVDNHHLSLNALKGRMRVGTIHFMAYINTLPVSVLIDGGSSDNFLQPRIAKFLKLPVEPAPFFKVMVGNGNYMTAEGIIRDLKVQAQGNIFHLPVFLLPISGADLILGASWLKTIGPRIADYGALHLKFMWNGHFTTLRGEPLVSPECAQLNHIRRMINTKSIVEVYSMQLINDSPQSGNIFDLPDSMDPELVALLNKYHVVFEPPTALPPSRSHDHSIPLIEGSLPVKVKPYRYPHSQKEEIEKLVRGLLEDGLVCPSKSPFSSPIILVKKKDGSWRVCTDYRALNAITIKDTFPIPTVDELLDEVHGASFFSKLDLRSGYHQILLNPEDRFKTTFHTHFGHYEWLVMPFGLTNAPATFQSLMNDIFAGFLRKFVLVFFDDILIYSATRDDHLTHL
ncbi:uncharacterized protein LOC106779047 [Vigna radiata var. radiata]|uniref:Uncharacterized protein LOC106779047 n=1 Tax=Vigna radiata var. radiata TaxID=3916 RepID=A0A1S3VW16_VIGRR|nr:uncharacterized protein LOC106779047 [Vigna radiata var. radiata]